MCGVWDGLTTEQVCTMCMSWWCEDVILLPLPAPDPVPTRGESPPPPNHTPAILFAGVCVLIDKPVVGMVVKGRASYGETNHKRSTSKKCRNVKKLKAKPSDCSVVKSCSSCGGTDHQRRTSKKCPNNKPRGIDSSVVHDKSTENNFSNESTTTVTATKNGEENRATTDNISKPIF